MTATPSTASQAPAVSIDTPEFRQRLRSLRNITLQETMNIELNEICDDIDARLVQDIVNPIEAMRREMPEGYQFNGAMAVQLAGKPEWYKQRAEKALAALASSANALGAGDRVDALEEAAQVCDQQADGTNGAYRTACLQCANAVRELRDATIRQKKNPHG